jgi:hypothetical protein
MKIMSVLITILFVGFLFFVGWEILAYHIPWQMAFNRWNHAMIIKDYDGAQAAIQDECRAQTRSFFYNKAEAAVLQPYCKVNP